MWVYAIHNHVNDKIYVGQTTRADPSDRWAEHLAHVKGTRQQHIYAAMRHHGVDAFEFVLLEECRTLEELDAAEMRWIVKFESWRNDCGYNRTLGGKQARFTPAARQKLSELNAGEKNPFYGKHHSEFARRAIGDAVHERLIKHHPTKGRSLSQEHKNKQSNSMCKRWEDPLYKQRLCESQRRRPARKQKLVVEQVNNIEARLASGELGILLAREYGVSPAMISSIKTGKHRCVLV